MIEEMIHILFMVLVYDDQNPHHRVAASLNQQIIIPDNPTISLILSSCDSLQRSQGKPVMPL
jgi:hypothetical protein